MKRRAILLTLLLVFLVATGVQAMNSAGYRLDWFTPLTTNSGGPAISAHYAADVTVGQTVAETSASAHYQARMGYWGGFYPSVHVYLPAIRR